MPLCIFNHSCADSTSLPAATMMLPKTLSSSIYTFMGCCKLAQVDVRKWPNFKVSSQYGVY